MNKKVIISIVIVVILLAAIGAGSYLVINRQNLFSQAQTSNTSTNTASNNVNTQGSSCPAPGTPATVTVSYPLCEVAAGSSQETCQFDKAGCTWESVSGVASYNVKVTEVETGVTIATESVKPPSVKTSFSVVQGRTYKCEVSAVSSCGTIGATNEDSLLCQVEGFVSPTPEPTPPPPTPTPTPTPVPTAPPVACGFSGCSTTVPCETGYICIETSVGQNYCARTEYQSQCYRAPGQAACCQAPQPKPTLPPAGVLDSTLIIGGVGVGLTILGAAALLLL